MELTSPAFAHNNAIPELYTCDGKNINPPLNIVGAPSLARSLALIVHDPDAPAEGGWTHWTLWNVDPALENIASGSIPIGAIEGMTDFGKSGYGGPCPPSGIHHYHFKLYALDSNLALDSSATRTELEGEIEDHILAEAVLTGLYGR